jgi:hypothetical protein
MKRLSLAVIVALFVIDGFTAARGQATKNVLTNHNDIYRTGVYAGESILRPSNVSPGRFGKVFARRVLGQIWGQPLYVQRVPVNDRLRNVVYVATSENMVYAFDADDRTPDEQTAPLLSVYLGAPDAIDKASFDFNTILPSNGISSTPVIDLGNPPDPRTGTLYVVTKLKQDHKFHVFALDLPTLTIRRNAQGQLMDVIICETMNRPPGRCASNSTLSFDPSRHMNRPALLISTNHLIVAFGSGPPDNDHNPHYHGWVMSFSLPDLVQTDAFVTTPTSDTGMGAVWQSGAGPAADDEGNIYFMTGNGHFKLPNLPDSFVRLANRDGRLQLGDWYTPRSRDVLEVCDLDLGTSGPVVIQESRKVLGAGKSGILYVLDKNNMGKDQPPFNDAERKQWRGDPDPDCATGPGQCFRVAEGQYQFQSGMKESRHRCDMSGYPYGDWGENDTDKNDDSYWEHVVMSYPHVHGSPVVWRFGDNSYNLYVWPESDFLKAYRFDGQQFSPSPIASSAPVTAAMMSMPGGVLSLSWDGGNPNTAIIWASRPNPNTKGVAGIPFVSVFHDQQHFVFRDKHGAIWDMFYQKDQNTWSFQQISTNGLPSASNIFVSAFASADQQHFVYTDSTGHIWDSFYRRAQGSWDFQPIDSHGSKPVGRIYVSAFYDQQHFVFRDATGTIWDSFQRTDDNWNCYQINPTGHPAPTDTRCEQVDTNGPPAASDIFVSGFGDELHFSYTDSSRTIWDSFYKKDHGWTFQQINTFGHTPAGGIFVSAFYDQQHFAFKDVTGTVWDSFHRANDGWDCNQINPTGHPAPTDTRCEQIDTNGSPAASDPFVSDFGDQQHFSYTDSTGNIWDSFYRKDHGWTFQQINTFGHTPAGGIFVSAFYDQQHFVYADAAGILWDSFYADADHQWHHQQINGCMFSQHGDYKQDMSPNDARCNAINKIVPGYLQAFSATPGRNGQLVELWNSENRPKDAVEWFAKGSPPTIADGKVFVAEFPAKPENEKWNDTNAFGRLLMYSLLRE